MRRCSGMLVILLLVLPMPVFKLREPSTQLGHLALLRRRRWSSNAGQWLFGLVSMRSGSYTNPIGPETIQQDGAIVYFNGASTDVPPLSFSTSTSIIRNASTESRNQKTYRGTNRGTNRGEA
ncbi:hypothetical protein F5Y09DRAFT_325744 [Xylaria sp. FL1042]|nr:hypothetical protein F5Y09DRAFT_325744 [Xylaria sp. FL1042]